MLMPIVKGDLASLAEAVNDKGVLPVSYYRMNLRLVCSPRAAHCRDALWPGFVIFLMITDNQEITGNNMTPSLITDLGPAHCTCDWTSGNQD